MQQKTAEMIFTLFLVFTINSTEKGSEFLTKTFVFWSAGTVAARWNRGGPLEPWRPAGTLLGLNVAL